MIVALGAISLIICAEPARAQMGGIDSDPSDRGTGGRNTIQGSIYLPGGRRLDRRVKVKLRSIYGEHFKMSDDTGAFSFRYLKGASYTLNVEPGGELENHSETVDIIEPPRRRNDPGQIYTVQIILQAKQSAPVRPAGTVDAGAVAIPDGAMKLYEQALESGREGDSKKAVEHLKEALKIYPQFAPALNELGVQYMRLKQLDKSAESLRAAIKLAPEAFAPRLNYGIVLIQLKDPVSAATELQFALQKESASAVARMHLGRAFINIGQYPKAERELQEAIRLGGSDIVESHRLLAAAYIEMKENSRAADALEKYLTLAPTVKDSGKIREIIKQLRGQPGGNH
jgi:Tfp pilus assembly protein PilF